MSFAGVSVIADGKLMPSRTSPSTASASGYHLLVVEGHSSTKNLPQDHLLLSRYFTIGGHSWLLFFYPNGRNHLRGTGFVSLALALNMAEEEETTANPVKAQVKFSFLDHPAHTHGSILASEYRGRSATFHDLGISKNLKDDSFTIRCDITVLNPKCDNSPFIEVPPSDMQQNFTDLLLSGEGTDVAFRVSGEMFAAHRCVLAARSTVFRAALFVRMKEGTSSSTAAVVQIDDMEAAVFKAMLGFIYGDMLPAVNADSMDKDVVLLQHLLVAADRYDLQRLRLMCEKKLCDCIGVGTVTTFLALAEQHGCDGLKKVCCKFLRCPDNLRAVVDTDGFDHLCRSCPSLMKDMILGVLPPKRKKE